MTVKKVYAAFLIAIVSFVFSSDGCSRGYESRKYAGDLEIILRSGRYPLNLGKNKLAVEVRDGADKPVSEALVLAKYSLSSMPGTPASEFKDEAKPRGKEYIFVAEIPGAGEWKMEITVSQPGKPALRATFTIDAR
jgi:hypothetical protein